MNKRIDLNWQKNASSQLTKQFLSQEYLTSSDSSIAVSSSLDFPSLDKNYHIRAVNSSLILSSSVGSYITISGGLDFSNTGLSAQVVARTGDLILSSSLNSIVCISGTLKVFQNNESLTITPDSPTNYVQIRVPSSQIMLSGAGHLDIRVGGTGEYVQFLTTGSIEFCKIMQTGRIGLGAISPGVSIAVSHSAPSVHLRRDGTNEWYTTVTAEGTDYLSFRAGGNAVGNDKVVIDTGAQVGIGAAPIDGHQLNISSSQGSTGESAIRAVFPAGGGLLNTEFGAIAHRGSTGGWAAVYGKQGAGACAAFFSGTVVIGGGNNVAGDPNPTATTILDISASNKAVVLPRNNGSGSITGINGMIHYNTSSNSLEAFINGGWKRITAV